jgi:tetratricopeptide (TPR) repeat protein
MWVMPSGDSPPVLLVPPDSGGAIAAWTIEPVAHEAEAAIDLDAVLGNDRDRPGPIGAERDVFEIDLSGELDDLLNLAQTRPAPGAAPKPAPGPGPASAEHRGGLEGYFEELREQRGRDLEGISSALAYDQASEHFNRGEVDSAAECLRTAARDPLYRFRAASMLARIARDQDRLGEAVEWLERAAEVAAPSVEAASGLLYELGDALAAAGEDARALAVFMELESSTPGYRDVGARVATLSSSESRRDAPRKAWQ